MDHAPSQGTHRVFTVAEADRGSLRAAITLALTLPGDTLLYLLLPIYAASFGVSLPEAGILLAANRLIRIAGYGWVARLYATHGPRAACLVAAVGSACSTLIYATLSGLWPLLLARLVWGLSYAAMNLANQALPTAVAERAAQRTGLSRAIIALGPTLGLLGGAAMAHVWGPRSVFYTLTLVACVAPVFAAGIPAHREEVRPGGPRFERPGAISIWSFAMGFTMDGIFIFGLGLLATASYPKGAVLAAGVAMALRYAVEVVFSPVGGRLAHRYGALRTLVLASLGAAVGLSILSADGWLLWLGIVATIVLRALAGPLAAPVVAEAYPGPERVHALARQATWRDIGAGTGPLAAGLLFPVAPLIAIYSGAAVLLAIPTLMLIGLRQGASRRPGAPAADRPAPAGKD